MKLRNVIFLVAFAGLIGWLAFLVSTHPTPQFSTESPPASSSSGDIGGGGITMASMFFLVLVLLYFLPSIVGMRHHNSAAIIILNLLLGWTVLGWIAALIWALSKPAPIAPEVRRVCLKCGAVHGSADRYCAECGAALGALESATASR